MAKSKMKFTPVATVPATWPVSGEWPVYGSKSLVLKNLDELTRRGAVVRVEGKLVIMGAQYMSWMQSQSDKVKGFSITPNDPAHAAKRFGGAAE